jgi:hypothetical protein
MTEDATRNTQDTAKIVKDFDERDTMASTKS